jgi:NAD(P)-dependent dehydrogenase (short-subunit alcohol dehydrogenase family)
MSLAHSTVVILGGSSGIGLATAKAAKAEGARVVVTCRSADRLKSAQALLCAEARTVALDVADEAGTRALFEELDRVDHVFITAGIVVLDSGLAPDSASLRPSLDTRFWGCLRRGQIWRRQDAGRRVHHLHVRD